MSYPQQPPYGQQPPGYGYQYPPRPPSTAAAYIAVALFVICCALTYVFAILSWDGRPDSASVLAAVIGVAFSDDLTGNVDFAIAASMTVASTTLLLALMLIARLGFVRWILAVLGGLVTAYYIYAAIWLLSEDGGEFIGLVILQFVLWLAATVVVVLPVTAAAMRGARPRFPEPPPPPQPYGGYYGPR